jgi:D-serine dehydratase
MRVVLRSGCYLSHDSLHYERMQSRIRQRSAALWGQGPGLLNALEVWAHVQALPEPGRAICALGKRDLSHDLELPQPLWWFRPGLHDAPQAAAPTLRVTALNDQHAFVDGPQGDLAWRVGDLVGFGVGHPCTTFDKWPLLYTVDDGYRVLDGVRTFF